MEKDFLLRNGVRLLFLGLLLLPFIYLMSIFSLGSWPFSFDFFAALKGAFSQSFLGATLTTLGGLVGACGLLYLRVSLPKRRVEKIVFLILLPSFIPPLLIVVSFQGFFVGYLQNLWGVVAIHSLISIGLAAVILEIIIQKKTQAWSDLCTIEGVSFWKFFLKGVLPELKNSILGVFLFFFISFFTSFTVPYLVGGPRYGGVEVLLYEKIFLYHQWSEALGIAICFSGLILLLSSLSFLKEEKINSFLRRETGGHLMAQAWGLVPLVFGVGAVLTPLTISILRALVVGGSGLSFNLLANTFLLGLGVGIGTLFLSLIVVFCFFNSRMSRMLFFFIPPGWMIVGFAFLLLPGERPVALLFKTILGLVIIFFPYLYRLILFQWIEDLRDQVDVARTLGATWGKICVQILWPQTLAPSATLAAIAGVWASGDFAITGVVFSSLETLPVAIAELMLNYRLSEALLLVPALIFVMCAVFFIFQGLSVVCRRKSY